MRLVVPFTPAGGPDFIARFVAERLSPRLGQPVVVENLPGASGNIGSLQVAQAKPDGLTIMSSVNTLVMNASLFRNLPYDPVADFAPLGLSAWGTLVLVAHPSQKPTTLAEMIALAKDRSQSQTYASPGVGTPHHLAMALLETASGIELVHVPYKGSAGAVQDLLSGQVGYMHQPGFGRGPGYPELNADNATLAALSDGLAAFRQGAGPEMGILLDSNFNFKTEGFIKVARACEPYNLFWLEIDSYDAEGLRLIRDRASMPIASCESLFGRRQFRPFFENRSMDVAIIDAPWNGVQESMKIAAMCWAASPPAG